MFTKFVEGLPDVLEPSLIAAAWEHLETLLGRELRRRSLWSSPPAYLGVFGWPSWEVSAVPGLDEGPLAELTAECYAFIFVDRLAALQAQLAVKPNIEGLVLLNVRHFLLERQRRHDPIGFRVFEMLQMAVREGVALGELFVLEGDPAVRNETVLGFEPTAQPGLPGRDLTSLVGRWNDDLLPDLVTARGRLQGDVQARVRAHLRGLADAGLPSFRFRDVVDPLKNDTRVRWAALMEPVERPPVPVRPGDLESESEPLRIVQPHLPLESHDRFVDLAERVGAAIEGLDTDRRTRRYLASLWSYLRSQADGGEGTLPEGGAVLEDDDWSHLSHRKLGQLLDIPRERMPDLFARLRGLVEQGRQAGPRRGSGGGEPAAHAEPGRPKHLEGSS